LAFWATWPVSVLRPAPGRFSMTTGSPSRGESRGD
jgi:hypothetical protein